MTTAGRLGATLRRLGSLVSGRRPARGSAAAPAPRPAGPTTGPRVEYAPHADGEPDPGEVVWAWVPYEDDASRGKDRPVLVVGRDGRTLLALPMTSKDHDRDAADEARWGRVWMDVGTGAWDPRRRPSEVRLDRVLRLERSAVRREGAAVDRALFASVTAAMADVAAGRRPRQR
ncbi:type II toxin-antitoxin system PemK/MazF family toxin [Cellulomonas biazotea]|uniref:mRNA interferase PemK n=1 Tax=Cellulomonas biazotea TaxID=1709 RepID=A0A402DUF5_9CELL|nr:type II toxin-antitoxin system PemK/MazF family toxin [Cellulomonas biazotea]GCE77725.1 hypothetical protein CBZ_27810 [Cellulomonas biazotea]